MQGLESRLAEGAVSATANHWNLETASFSGTQVDFAADPAVGREPETRQRRVLWRQRCRMDR